MGECRTCIACILPFRVPWGCFFRQARPFDGGDTVLRSYIRIACFGPLISSGRYAKDRSIEVTETLIGVIEARDSNLNGHSRNVQKLSMCLYKYLPASMKEGISPVSFEYAALLHDVGKLGVPESILNKPGKLDPGEWDVMKQHPKIAMDLLKSLSSFDEIKDWILYHHERIDGKGYYGLPGDDIPMAARIIAVCDTYSAITMRRSYKDKRTHEEAMDIIKDVSGSQLDPDIVAVFMTIPKEELQACTPETVDF